MPYRFTNLTDATTYLSSLGFTVSSVMMNWITPLRSSSRRADLFYDGQLVGYLETPTDILPDEDWCVNIPFEKRSIVPGGVLNAVFGNTGGNEGWENRQFYIETDHFTRFQFGRQLEHTIEAYGPGSTIRLKTTSDVLSLYKVVTESSEDAVIDIDLPELAQQLRYEFADIIDNVAVYRPRPSDMDLTGAQPGYVISLDNNYVCKWLPLSYVLGNTVVPEAVNAQKLNNLDADEYINTNNLTTKLTEIVSNNIENGITVIADDGKLHFQANSFTINLTGAVVGNGVVNNLGNVSIYTTADNTLHNHNDLYVKLQGNSVVNGTVGGNSFNSSIGAINGFKFLSVLTDDATTRSRIYTIWDVDNVRYDLTIKTEDVTNDSISIQSGYINVSSFHDMNVTSDNVDIEYTNKTETGTSAVYTADEMIMQTNNIGVFASENIVLEATNNIILTIENDILVNATQLLSLTGNNVQITSSINDIVLTSAGDFILTATNSSIDSEYVDITSSNTLTLTAANNIDITSNDGTTSIISDNILLSAQYINVTGTGSPNRFYVTADNIDFYTGVSALQTRIDDGITLTAVNAVPIVIPNGYTISSYTSTENVSTTKVINTDAFNINATSFLVNGDSMAFTGGDATFSNDVYINGALHLSGGSSGGSSLSTEDKFVILNAAETGAGVSAPGTSGIEIDRGTLLNVRLFWNESDTSFKILDHNNIVYKILTEYDIPNTLDTKYVLKSGTTMTGSLVLNSDPINALEAATKQYVDNSIANHDSQHSDTYLALAGGDLTGATTISVTPTNPLDVVNKTYVDNSIDNSIDTTINARRKTYTIGDGVSTSFELVHNFNSNFYCVTVMEAISMNEVVCGIQHTSVNTVKLFFDTPPDTDSILVFLMV